MILVSPSTYDGTDVGVRWRGITRDEANAALIAWGHKMGPMTRVDYGQEAFTGLIHDGRLVAVACTSGLVREAVGGASWATRETAVELSRLCAANPKLNRAALRLWREFTFPAFGVPWAISYQDADIHNGNTYRFDGWQRVAYCAGGSSTDQRTGRKGRNKWVWAYPPDPAHEMTTPTKRSDAEGQ